MAVAATVAANATAITAMRVCASGSATGGCVP